EEHNKLLDLALLDSMNTIPIGLSLSLPLYVRLKKIYDSLEKRVIKHVRLVTIVTFTGKPVVEPILVSIPNGGLRKFSFTRMNDDKIEICTFTGNLQYLPGNLPYLQRDGEVVWFECSKVCKVAEVQ